MKRLTPKRAAVCYIVNVPASGAQSWLVLAKSKAEAIRKCRMNDPDIEPLQGDLEAIHWSRATASIDEKH